jgi:hypothetical protein
MVINPDDWQKRLIDQTFSLTQGEEDARRQLIELADDTNRFLVSVGLKRRWFGSRSEGGFDHIFANLPSNIAAPTELISRWNSWGQRYELLVQCNPQIEMRDVIEACSETHDFTSWPQGWEADILRWILAGHWQSPPFDDRMKILDEAFFNRLRQLHRLCGGWLFWDHQLGRAVFLPDTEAQAKPLWFGRHVQKS